MNPAPTRAAEAQVLLVEPDPLIRALLREALADGGFRVSLARDGLEALARLAAARRLSGLVTEVDLGRVASGWDVAEAARRRFPGLAVLYTTAGVPVSWRAHGVFGGRLLMKPFLPSDAVAALQEISAPSSNSRM